MPEKKIDRMLRIRTTGLREWRDHSTEFNRYEATPYEALNQLFEVYKLKAGDKLVDFGCGRGRVPFYIHYHFRIPVTGIEVNDKTYEEALQNKMSYRQHAKHIQAPIKLKYGLAEHYEVKKTDNRFYFFNPFSANIFKDVVSNIMSSIEEHERSADIILYYPLKEYKQVLKKHTPFELINKVRVPGAKDKKEKFLIYRYRS